MRDDERARDSERTIELFMELAELLEKRGLVQYDCCPMTATGGARWEFKARNPDRLREQEEKEGPQAKCPTCGEYGPDGSHCTRCGRRMYEETVDGEDLKVGDY